MKTKFNESEIIISAYSFDANGKSTSLKQDEIPPKISSRKLSWIHIDGSHKNSRSWLENNALFLDDLIIDALFDEETRPRIIEFDDGMLIILRAANSIDASKEGNMSSVRIWIDQNGVISVQKKHSKPVVNVINDIESGKKFKNAGELLYNLLEHVLDLTASSIYAINDRLDEVENKILNNRFKDSDADLLSISRKQTTALKRYMLPQKDVLSHLQTTEYSWIDDWSIRNFQEHYNTVNHLIEELDETKERSQIIHDEVRQELAERLNKSAFKISLIASIFLPLSFVASLFGMNVGGIPLSGHASGFYIVSYFMIVIFGALYLVLKNKNNL